MVVAAYVGPEDVNRVAGEPCPNCGRDVADIIDMYTDVRNVRGYKLRCPDCCSVWVMHIG